MERMSGFGFVGPVAIRTEPGLGFFIVYLLNLRVAPSAMLVVGFQLNRPPYDLGIKYSGVVVKDLFN
jgi:hypothetical protein